MACAGANHIMIKPKLSRFFEVSHDRGKNPIGMLIGNNSALKAAGTRSLFPQSDRSKGFSHFPLEVKPVLFYDKKQGRYPKDLESFLGYWLITSSLKKLFETISLSSFQFIPCNEEINGIVQPSEFWLCDVVKIIDCIDKEKTSEPQYYNELRKRQSYALFSVDNLVIDEVRANSHRIFRPFYAEDQIICDIVMRDALRREKPIGLTYRKCGFGS